jgi:hypothetical protein
MLMATLDMKAGVPAVAPTKSDRAEGDDFSER